MTTDIMFKDTLKINMPIGLIGEEIINFYNSEIERIDLKKEYMEFIYLCALECEHEVVMTYFTLTQNWEAGTDIGIKEICSFLNESNPMDFVNIMLETVDEEIKDSKEIINLKISKNELKNAIKTFCLFDYLEQRIREEYGSM